MQSVLTAKEQLNADTPLFLLDCTMPDGTKLYWCNRSVNWSGIWYEPRLLRHNLFEAQLASDVQVGGAPRLSFELANADSHLSELERQIGFKGAQLTVRSIFFDLDYNGASTDSTVVFRGLMNPPDSITESVFRLSAMNRMAMQRTVVPEVRVQRMCPWRFPATPEQRLIAIDGGPRGKYSPLFRCGYSPDQPNGVGNMNGDAPFTTCSYTRPDCEQRGMFVSDASGRTTGRFGGVEYVPPTILVRGSGQKNYQLSAVQDNVARYNDFVPLVYGTQWHVPDVVFSRNDGNLTRFEVLLGMGEIQGILKVLVDDIEIPEGIPGTNMTSTGWYNLTSAGSRNGTQDGNFADGQGVPQGDPYGSMAYLSVVVPNRISNGTSIPSIQVLEQGLRLLQFDTDGNYLGEFFSTNPSWILLDVLMRSGYTMDEVDLGSFARTAAYADELITVDDPVGGTIQIPRFQCEFALKTSRSAGEILRAIRNAARTYLVLNGAGLIEARVENTFALQQAQKPGGSNAQNQFDGGWPAYEFDASSIARNADASSSLKLAAKAAQDTPNRLSVEFQDSLNQYQQDSLSLADEDDVDLCGQEISATWDAVGISTFNQAARMLLLGLNRSVAGNAFIEFQTSVKALGLMPGDLITVTYLKENLQRTPFRITRIAPGASFRTATITAQYHDDAWYSDTVTGITGGLGRHSGSDSGIPAPVAGTVADATGELQLGITESEVISADGTANVELAVSFTAPSGTIGTLPAPLIGLTPVVSSTGGTLTGGGTWYYAVSALDANGGESPMSFVVQAILPAAANTNSVLLDGIGIPAGGSAFHVYRGLNPESLLRIATNQSPAPSFIDTGFAAQPVLPPDPRFDHVNVSWRWEMVPETAAAIRSLTSVGNPTLQMHPNRYQSCVARLTRGTGAGQERTVVANTATELSVDRPWSPEPDSNSYFVIAENSWRFGAKGAVSPIAIDVPERIANGVHISALAANANDEEAAYDLSPLTRWVLGQSGGLAVDSDLPPAPIFGLALSNGGGGVIDLSAIGFATLLNTRSIIAGTCKFYSYDEINGGAPFAISTAIGAGDTTISISSKLAAGTLIQIDGEILGIAGANADGTLTVDRGQKGSTATAHASTSGTLAYVLGEKVVIVPFVRGFFGTPASGDWKYSVSLPDVRLACAELFLTNSLGDGPSTANCYTGTQDGGLRTMAGGQYAFQVSGYLAAQTNAAPLILVDADRSVLDIAGMLTTPPLGSGVSLQINRNGSPYAALEFAEGATSTVVRGFGMPALKSGDQLSLDITGVGSTIPGSDLSVILRL
jgi:hypothetical protein